MTTENLDQGTGATNNEVGEQNAEVQQPVEGQQEVTTEGQQQEQAKPESEVQVPESYEFNLPEGIELDTAAAEQFTEVAKSLKLSQEQANSLTSIMVEMRQREAESHASQVEAWVNQVKTDKEIGGDALEQNLSHARKAIEVFGSPELKELLDATGLGNHPAIIKFAVAAGKKTLDDKLVTGAPKAGESSLAKKLFPDMN